MQPSNKELRKVATASVIGATIEWYDFFLYGIVASIVFNKLYFPAGDPTVNTLLAYGHGDPIYIGAYVLFSGILSSLCAFAIARRQKNGLTFNDDVVHDDHQSSNAKPSAMAQRA